MQSLPVTITVHGYDWIVKDNYDENGKPEIHCWSLNKDSIPYLLRFKDFPVYLYVELPTIVNHQPIVWTSDNVQELVKVITKETKSNAPIDYSLVSLKKLYYYQCNKEYPFLKLFFRNIRSMNFCKGYFESPIMLNNLSIQCHVFEDMISLERRLLSTVNLAYSQWFHAKGKKVPFEHKVSTIEEEYNCDWKSIEPIPLEESKRWITKPRILAFDIECYSENHRAMPNMYNSLDVVYMISCIYQRYHSPKSRKRYGIILGDCNDIPNDKLENCTIYRVKSEYELVETFGRIVRETDPEILVGYNILGFDYRYLNHRIKRILKNWPIMGRIIGEESRLVTKLWESSAYGHQNINILEMDGRISIDLYTIIKRDFKLDKYDLNSVAKKFIGKEKHNIKPVEMFKIYESTKRSITEMDLLRAKSEMTRIMEYCIQDSELVIDLMEKLNIWVGLVEMSNIVGTTIVDLFTRGQQVRCLSQIYNLASKSGYILDRRSPVLSKFSGGHVYDPVVGLHDNVICLDFASLYPSIIMAYNICYTTLVPKELDAVVPDTDCHVIEFTESTDVKYRFKFYKKQEGILPRLVRQLVSERRAINRQIEQLKQENKNLENNTDFNTKQRIEDNKLLITLLDKRQWALKITANSFFGFLGTYEGGRMPLIEGAMCITAKGRELIKLVKEYIEEKYQGIEIYGDTDSVMVKLPQVKNSKDCYYWGTKLSQEINGIKPGEKDCDGVVWPEGRIGLFPSPLSMEFEKAMRLFCITKKKYAAYLIGKDGNFKKEDIGDSFLMLTKGIILARRDNCRFVRQLYTKILRIIMSKGTFAEAIDVLVDSIYDLLNNKVPYEDLVIIRELGSNYKSKTSFMKVFSENLRNCGKNVVPGDRLDYLVVKSSDDKLLGNRMRLVEQYLDSLNTKDQEQIDYEYYINKQLLNPIQQLLEIGFKEEINKIVPRNNIQWSGKVFNPIKVILDLHSKGIDFRILKNFVRQRVIKLLVVKNQ